MNKVSNETLAKYCESHQNEDIIIRYPTEDSEFSVLVKTELDIANANDFIDAVVEFCFTENGEYNPQYKEIIFNVLFAKYMTNLTLPVSEEDNENVDIEKAIKTIETLDIVNLARDEPKVNEIVCHLLRCIEKKIDYKIKLYLNKEHKQLQEIIEKLNTYTQMMETTFDGVDINQLVKSTSSMSKKLHNMSEQEVISTIINNIQDKKVAKDE